MGARDDARGRIGGDGGEPWLRSGLAALRTRPGWTRGRLVVCPDARASAIVERGPGGAIVRCSRWPGRAACSEACIHQHPDPNDRSLLEHVVEEWYGDHACAGCGRAFLHADWDERAPALLDAAGTVVRWGSLDPDDLVGVLQNHEPLCSGCAARLEVVP